MDFPSAAFAVELAAHYPAAKVVLTERDPERWYQELQRHHLPPMSEELPDRLADWSAMVRKAIVGRVFDGNITDKAHVIACYERHNAMIRRSIPPTACSSSRSPTAGARYAAFSAYRSRTSLSRNRIRPTNGASEASPASAV